MQKPNGQTSPSTVYDPQHPPPYTILKDSNTQSTKIPAYWLLSRYGRSLFDAVLVALSLATLGPVPIPTTFVRTLRAFRVIKLFGKVEQVRPSAANGPSLSKSRALHASGPSEPDGHQAPQQSRARWPR